MSHGHGSARMGGAWAAAARTRRRSRSRIEAANPASYLCTYHTLGVLLGIRELSYQTARRLDRGCWPRFTRVVVLRLGEKHVRCVPKTVGKIGSRTCTVTLVVIVYWSL